MAHKKERTIGEKFEMDKIIYQVVKTNSCSCEGCAFFDEEFLCTDWRSQAGQCGGDVRKDGEDVIFVKVGEANDTYGA